MLLRLEGATLGYGGSAVLRDVSLAVDGGDYLAVVGSNGSGKTTLLRTLLGALPLLSGRVERSPELRLGYVPQQMALDPLFPLTALEVAEMGLWRGRAAVAHIPHEERAVALQCLEQVEMGAHGRKPLGALSGGQKQRVLMARALVSRPNCMLLDEPVAGVDARATEIILGILDRLHRGGTAILLVSQHPLALRQRATAAWLVAGGTVAPRDPQTFLTPQGLVEVFG